jgi:hypothetical protein
MNKKFQDLGLLLHNHLMSADRSNAYMYDRGQTYVIVFLYDQSEAQLVAA